MIPNVFEVSEFTRDRFFGREQISNLYIGDFFAFVSYEIDLIVIGFSYLDIIPTIEEFKIDNVFIQFIVIDFVARFTDIPQS